MISDAAIAKTAARIRAREGVDEATAMKRAQRWAKRKAREAAEAEKLQAARAHLPADMAERKAYLEHTLGPGACLAPAALARAGGYSPRCPCDGCRARQGEQSAFATRAYSGSCGGW